MTKDKKPELTCIYCNNNLLVRERRLATDKIQCWTQCGTCSATGPVADSRDEAIRLAGRRHVCDDHRCCCNTCDHKCGIELIKDDDK